MSPEQALGGMVDARSDLYGFGATAFYAFSGRFLFEGNSATEILAKQVTEPPPQLGSLGLTVPRKLASLVDRCLAKNPEHRPVSAQALAEQLGVAIEQRREVPAALRAFVKRYGRLDGGGSLVAGTGVLVGSVAVSAGLGGAAGFATLVLGATVAPFAYLVSAARRLSLLGFNHQDLGPAFKGQIEQASEEMGVEHRGSFTQAERVLSFTAKASWTVYGGSIAAMALMDLSRWDSLLSVFALSGVTAILSSIGLLALLQRRRDIDTEFWSRLWMGRLGKAAISLARKLIGNRVRSSAMTHRATELSLGMAAEQLFESLPKESRKALGDVPSLLGRLQRDAQVLRQRYDERQEGTRSG